MKKINWIEEFIKTQEIKAENKNFLKTNKIIPIFKGLVSSEDNLREQISSIEKLFLNLYDDILKLNKIISHQKQRITRQTREQNKEKKYYNTSLSVIYKRLGELENK